MGDLDFKFFFYSLVIVFRPHDLQTSIFKCGSSFDGVFLEEGNHEWPFVFIRIWFCFSNEKA